MLQISVDTETDRLSELNAPLSEISDQGDADGGVDGELEQFLAMDESLAAAGHEGSPDKELLLQRFRRLSEDIFSLRSDLEHLQHDLESDTSSAADDPETFNHKIMVPSELLF